MKRLIIHGDPGIRKDGVIDLDGDRLRCFSVTRNGDWYGPDEVQLWCIVGDDDEREAFEHRQYIPHFLDVERVDAEAIEVIQAKGELTA